MILHITTKAESGSLLLFIMNSAGAKILTLRNTDEGKCTLIPGNQYRFEWHVWDVDDAAYSINAEETPAPAAFPPFHWTRKYAMNHEDFGGFYFTA